MSKWPIIDWFPWRLRCWRIYGLLWVFGVVLACSMGRMLWMHITHTRIRMGKYIWGRETVCVWMEFVCVVRSIKRQLCDIWMELQRWTSKSHSAQLTLNPHSSTDVLFDKSMDPHKVLCVTFEQITYYCCQHPKNTSFLPSDGVRQRFLAEFKRAVTCVSLITSIIPPYTHMEDEWIKHECVYAKKSLYDTCDIHENEATTVDDWLSVVSVSVTLKFGQSRIVVAPALLSQRLLVWRVCRPLWFATGWKCVNMFQLDGLDITMDVYCVCVYE